MKKMTDPLQEDLPFHDAERCSQTASGTNTPVRESRSGVRGLLFLMGHKIIAASDHARQLENREGNDVSLEPLGKSLEPPDSELLEALPRECWWRVIGDDDAWNMRRQQIRASASQTAQQVKRYEHSSRKDTAGSPIWGIT